MILTLEQFDMAGLTQCKVKRMSKKMLSHVVIVEQQTQYAVGMIHRIACAYATIVLVMHGAFVLR